MQLKEFLDALLPDAGAMTVLLEPVAVTDASMTSSCASHRDTNTEVSMPASFTWFGTEHKSVGQAGQQDRAGDAAGSGAALIAVSKACFDETWDLPAVVQD